MLNSTEEVSLDDRQPATTRLKVISAGDEKYCIQLVETLIIALGGEQIGKLI